ncbi:tetratricopeptide repeat protein [Simiduia curdlanivorans]|uniref:Tetratricopeptide repeat protein n=1 Tax=Simiduia curdlanivorans TaxID=1492769 RepID=A0ABV8V2Q6_9GAMM|nr:tetratricopeptide repeat protein [Simiduia curdlanivorans]MDN3637475.1 tetratricopeptide repeat protein [Simiduia curdlanivorans]
MMDVNFVKRLSAGCVALSFCLLALHSHGAVGASELTASDNDNFNFASIVVKLKEPRWAFLLANEPVAPTEAQLAASESRFARDLQPLLAAQKYAEIAQAFKARPIANDSAALRQLRGQVLLSMGRYKDAEAALDAALALMPNLALAHRSLSMVHLLQKQLPQAQKHLQRSIALGVADAQVYGQLAFVNLRLGNAASAVAGYQQALYMEADNEQWQQGLLYALIQSHGFDQAQALLEQMLEKNPSHAELWLQRGQLALKQARPQQALSSMEMALQLGDASIDNICTTAQLHIQAGSPRRAAQLLADNITAIAKQGEVKLAVVEQVSAWLAYRQAWGALAPLLRAVEKNRQKLPRYYQSQFAVYGAQWALHNGEQRHAGKQLQQAIAANPSNGEALLALATLMRSEKREERAVLYYARAEALTAYQERARLGRAQLEIDRQNYAEALRLLRQVAQVNPSRGDVMSNIQSLEHLLRNKG